MGRELLEGGATDSYVNVYTDIQAPVKKQEYGPDDTTNALAVGQIITGDIPGNGKTFTGTRNLSTTDNIPTETGRFNCAPATQCSISVDDKGVIVALQNYTWQPIVRGSTTSTVDADYLAWGVWLTVPDDVATAASAGAFASGSNAFEVRAELKGTATYNGVASGVYSAGGMVEYFDADVSLMANFGGTVGADNSPDSPEANDGLLIGAVTGTVSGIKAGGMDVEGSLALKRATIVAGAQDGNNVAGFEAAAEGTVGGALLKGRWGGQFYGPNDETADSKAAETEYPTTAAGTFGVTGGGHSPMSLLGSFGTWKAD